MKKWRDVDEVVKMVHELPSEKLKNYDREMQKKPKFDHIADSGKKVKKKHKK